MRMRVFNRRFAVGGPADMTDAAGRRQLVRFSGRRRTQIAELARRFENIDSAVVYACLLYTSPSPRDS